ncbi:hypothetical protein Alches_02730 [Alicyclobacillus hesperidum subsp. aegles]|uniref:Uncharacterized protein n=1 Tax=Alicyclobacillus hesperidum TaxID=89784 RepID=A0A1H2U361_9BACL|nr:hypothetical protein [Alicyclobacillus hesperidum]KRW91755.1 hypothetical protein SD51_07735 [Alicyclobacillus tengchongensis]GLG00234.1 hypothetical protein Alches_02730 [Alicyclobacillus hesperidum subsp. aegles]GLV14062.1 hypothetical protein Heshes_17460 [Alicyclobacillus hesperidum]SDW50652.1 hypothetical protein SAMN04489725_10730 [Alicyclobacillus hesperidum]
MCTKADCERYIGKMVGFRTKYGYHVGFVERVTQDSAIILSPRKYIPTEFASANVSDDELQRLDLALAQWGGAPGAGYGGFGGGYGGWGWGWGRWAVSFLIIYVLWGLAGWWW